MEKMQKQAPGPCPYEKRFPSQLNRDAVFFMELAFNQAIEAWAKGEVPIGAVIEHKGELIASAHNQVEATQDPTAHAEMLAITQAANKSGDWRLNECTLFVTKEPCPMCAGASIMARLDSVIYGFGDPKMGCLGGAFSLHELPQLNHKLKTEARVLEDECKALVQAFFAMKR